MRSSGRANQSTFERCRTPAVNAARGVRRWPTRPLELPLAADLQKIFGRTSKLVTPGRKIFISRKPPLVCSKQV